MSDAESQELIENEVVEEVVTEEVEENTEISEEAKTEEEATEGEDFDIVLEGDEEPAPQKAKMPKRVKKLLEKNTALQTDLDTQAQSNAREIERLKQELVASRAPNTVVTTMPMPPLEEDHGYDPDKLAQARVKYQNDMQSWILQQNQAVGRQQAETETQNRRASKEHEALEAHYARADKLKVSDYDVNESNAVSNLGKDLVKSIATSLPNSAMVINYLGKNEAAAREIANLDKTDPGAGIAKLWELNFKLKAVPRKKSNAPDPESRVEGGGGSVSSMQKKYDAATEKGDIKTRRALRKQAKAKGITLTD